MALISNYGRTLAAATALLAGTAYAVVPTPAHALSTGAAVGIGVGAFALGSALGAVSNPYYGYPGYGYGYGYPSYGGYYGAPVAPAYPYYGSSYYGAPAYNPYWGY